MNKQNEIYKMIEEEHLDFMIKLACKRRSAEEIEQFLNEISAEPTEEEILISKAAYARFEEKLAAQRKADQRRMLRHSLHRNLSRAIQAVACIVIALGIAAPIAVASSPAIRARVMQLLVTLESDHTRVGLRDTVSALDVPDGWIGDYFPSYIPEGYEFVRLTLNQGAVVYQHTSGSKITYSEFVHKSNTNVDTERSVSSYADIHGQRALIYEQDQYTYVMWDNEIRYFVLESDLPKQELLKIAESVCLIQ